MKEYMIKKSIEINGDIVWYWQTVDWKEWNKHTPDSLLDEVIYGLEGGALGTFNNPYDSQEHVIEELEE